MIVRISLEGADRALRVLDDTPEAIHEGMWHVLQEIGAIVEEEAQALYDGWDDDEGNTVVVWTDENPNEREVTVIAEGVEMQTPDGMPAGNTVVLEEFGAGWAAEDHPLATEYGVYPGQWSIEWGQKQWANNPEYWVHEYPEGYYNYHTYIPATMAMYKASEKAKRSLRTIVREEFMDVLP